MKHFGQERDDLVENLNKYLFENWNSIEKNKFKVTESENTEGLLEFKAYIEIETYEELIEGTKIILEFLEYAEEWNKDNGKVVYLWQQKDDQFVMPMNNIYLMKGNNPIVPHSGLFQTSDEIIENAKQIYKEISN